MSDTEGFTLAESKVGEHKLAKPGVWLTGLAILVVIIIYMFLSALYGRKK